VLREVRKRTKRIKQVRSAQEIGADFLKISEMGAAKVLHPQEKAGQLAQMRVARPGVVHLRPANRREALLSKYTHK
jgi:hypothetical protein